MDPNSIIGSVLYFKSQHILPTYIVHNSMPPTIIIINQSKGHHHGRLRVVRPHPADKNRAQRMRGRTRPRQPPPLMVLLYAFLYAYMAKTWLHRGCMAYSLQTYISATQLFNRSDTVRSLLIPIL